MSVSDTVPSGTTPGLGKAQRRFVDDYAQLLARYGLALTVGRAFGLLLLSDDPLSLDEIAARLGVSKTGASVATRDLERLGLVRRLGTPGSRRLLYETDEDAGPIFEAQSARFRQQLVHLRRADLLLAEGRAKDRLRRMIELHEFWLDELGLILARWRAR